jgi:hypothetical protein
LIHHSSKGSQSNKSVTDVGSGAGAQSRATDSHLILRPHEEPGTVVLEAACRSWPPIEPRCLIWEFPVWKPATELDPTALLGASEKRRQAAEKEQQKAVQREADAAAVLHAMAVNDPENAGITYTSARNAAGLSGDRGGPAVTLLLEQNKISKAAGTTTAGNGAKKKANILRRILGGQL